MRSRHGTAAPSGTGWARTRPARRPSTSCSRWPSATRSSTPRTAPGGATDRPPGRAGHDRGVTDGRAVEELVVGVLGGTGPQGRGLAVRLAGAGQRILRGSRDAARAAEVAAEVWGRATSAAAGGEVSVQGGSNVDVAGAADLVIV